MLYVKYPSIWTANSREEHFLKFTKFYPFLPLIVASIGVSPLILGKLESPFPIDASYQIWFKSVQWFWRVSILNVFPYISLCNMKRPLVRPFLGGFYFYAQTLQTMPQGCCMSNIRVFGLPVHDKKIFKFSPNFTPFSPLLGPNTCQPLDFRKFESPFPKDTSYQIWFKSVQWFWRRSLLKERFTDGRQTVADDTYSSL